MIRFRIRRATLLPSTLTFALVCQAGLAFAQSPEGWPFEDSAPANQDAAAAPKSAVQQQLEELYRRDGRPLPDYMRRNATNGNAQNAAPAQTQAAQAPPAQQPQQIQQQPAPLVYRPAQPVPLVSPAPYQESPIDSSPKSIRQQLAEYYASQGQTMPGTRPNWNSADTPRQPVAQDAGQGAQSGSAAPATPQEPLLQRLNPFRGFWHKDDAADTPTATAYSTPAATDSSAPSASSSSNVAGDAKAPAQAMSSQNGVTYATMQAPAPGAPKVAQIPAPHAVQPPVRQPPHFMTVDLGQTAPTSSIPRPATQSSKPMTLLPAASASQPSVASRASVPSTPAPPAKTAPSAPAAPAVAAKTPAQQPHPATAAGPAAPRKVAGVPFDAKSETDADKKTGPYTGAALQEADDAVSTPNPTKVTTANADKPADHARVAPTPAVDGELSHSPAPKASTSPPSAAHQHAVASQPAAGHAVLNPTARPAETPAPKAFSQPQPASELSSSDSTAAKMHQIGERVGQKGLKGFCPVALREHRELADALPIYSSTFAGRRYYFSSAEAKRHFDQAPQKYAPAAGGIDVVVKSTSQRSVEGSLDFAVWYKDHLFLFSSPESLDAFSDNPLPYASPYLKAH
jgi:YHS domain-containing protein